jgi:type IV secretory pathway VirB6-like protein
MDQGLFFSFYTFVERALIAGVSSVVASGISYASGPLKALLVIYIGITGYLALTGQADAPFQVLVTRVVRASFVVYLLTGPAFSQYIFDLFMNGIPGALAHAINNVQGPDAAARQFDVMVSATKHQTAQILQEATGISNIGTRAIAHVAQWIIDLALGAAFLIWEAGRVLMGVVIAAGPFVLTAYLFSATRPIVERWLGKMVSLTLLQLLVTILLQISIQGEKAYLRAMQAALQESGVEVRLEALLQVGVFFVMCAFLLIMLPSLAYSMGTGISFSTQPIVLWWRRFVR